MKKGDTVFIYHDPITRNELEGEAKLVELLSKTPDMETWEVRFIDVFCDKKTYVRRIYTGELSKPIRED